MAETTISILEEYVAEVREPAGFARPDGEIAEEIRRALADDADLDERAIRVEVAGGKVTLSGTVRNAVDLRRAEAHGCAVVGATAVLCSLRALDEGGAEDASEGTAAKMGKPEYDL